MPVGMLISLIMHVLGVLIDYSKLDGKTDYRLWIDTVSNKKLP